MPRNKTVTERMDYEHLGRVLVARRQYFDALRAMEIGPVKRITKKTLARIAKKP